MYLGNAIILSDYTTNIQGEGGREGGREGKGGREWREGVEGDGGEGDGGKEPERNRVTSW